MRIGGFQKFSLIDFPGRIAAVVFTRGCNFRCPWCHNPELAMPSRYGPAIPVEEVLRDLGARRGFLEGVVITGGEPTIQPDLPGFLARIRAMGFAIKLDTNGSRPPVIRRLLRQGVVDYIAMDVKAPLDTYAHSAGIPVDTGALRESIRLIRDSGIAHEFRTTLVRPFVPPEALPRILDEIGPASPYRLQPFAAGGKLVDPAVNAARHYSSDEVSALRNRFERLEPAAAGPA